MIQKQQSPAVNSPCRNVCTLDAASGLCHGCWRTIDEISLWSSASNADKLSILAAVSRRREALGQ